MLSPDGGHSCLRVGVPDDSDGALSLALRWDAAWDRRDRVALPPGWMRLEVPMTRKRRRRRRRSGDVKGMEREGEEEEEGKEEDGKEEEGKRDGYPEDEKKIDSVEWTGLEEEKRREEKSSLSRGHASFPSSPTSLRFRLDHLPSNARSGSTNLTLSTATWETCHKALPSSSSSPSLDHLRCGPAATWFPSIALSLGLSKALPLYMHSLPPSIYSLAIKDTIPCGVLVLLDLMLADEEAPDWDTKYDPAEDGLAHHQHFLARQRSLAAERMMTGEQARIAKATREAEELHRVGEEFRARMARQREREERREREAFASGRLEAAVVAEKGLKYLVREKLLNEGEGTQKAVEGLLVGMIKQEKVAMGVCGVLERWQEWSDRGGMNSEDLTMFRKDKIGFCYAACVMGLLRDVCIKEESSVAADMQECIRVWKKVRLG